MAIWAAMLAAIAVIALDRVSKAAAMRCLAVAGRRGGILRLVQNRRPFLRPGASGATFVAMWVLAALCGAVALWVIPNSGSRGLAGAGLALALGGAASNIADRLVKGVIADFIAIGCWFVFNLADVAIVSGAALAFASLI
jgi:lipoprotein signal peptidase